ncbi:MAG: hypothetical protein LBU99_03140 [Spirochaetaceae bacterium]|jgi:hypothetical protein|nr:hypothetical protein [Spirochaetaceae bacterium]
MKKIVYTLLLLVSVGSLWGQTWGQQKPFRYFELGADVDVGLANNYLSIGEIFQDTLVIDLNKMAKNGFKLSAAADAHAVININFGSKVGVGFFAGAKTSIYGGLEKPLFDLMFNEDNLKAGTISGDAVALGGNAFADAGLYVSAEVGRLKFKVSPAMYIPLVYIPKSDVSYELTTTDEGNISIKADTNLNIYAPVALSNEGSFTYDVSNLNTFLEGKGFDLSLDVEYALFPILDLGLSVDSIPIVPAVLNKKIGFSTELVNIEMENALDQLINGSFEIPELPDFGNMELEYSEEAAQKVFRPMTFDVYALFRPLKSNFLVLRPNIALSFFTVYGKPVFGAGVLAQMNVLRVFSLDLGIGYKELLWKTQLGFMLNLRVLQLNVKATLQSQDFVGMFKASGLDVAVGFRLGF